MSWAPIAQATNQLRGTQKVPCNHEKYPLIIGADKFPATLQWSLSN